MKYTYHIETGLTRTKSRTKKYIVGVMSSVALVGSLAFPTFAAKPANPGCFGADRAAYIQDVALTSDAAPGASEVGHILADRAGENGAINQAYKTGCGGDPTQL